MIFAAEQLRDLIDLAVLLSLPGLVGPPFAGDTTLYEFFGYFSLFCSVVLIMRVIVSVLHDGVN